MRDNNYLELKAKASELGWVVTEYNTIGKEDEVILRFRPKLTKNKYYSVWEPGMDEWLTMECIGYDKIRNQYIFTSQQDIEFFMYVYESDVNDEVKELGEELD